MLVVGTLVIVFFKAKKLNTITVMSSFVQVDNNNSLAGSKIIYNYRDGPIDPHINKPPEYLKDFPFYVYTMGNTCDDGVTFKIAWKDHDKNPHESTLLCTKNEFWGSNHYQV